MRKTSARTSGRAHTPYALHVHAAGNSVVVALLYMHAANGRVLVHAVGHGVGEGTYAANGRDSW